MDTKNRARVSPIDNRRVFRLNVVAIVSQVTHPDLRATSVASLAAREEVIVNAHVAFPDVDVFHRFKLTNDDSLSRLLQD